MIKLSVIVPVYNVAKYLKQCVDSILIQQHNFGELILVNDGSADESGEICDYYAKQDKRVKVIHQHNQGHTAARQAGFKKAKGEYILFIDSDDWIAPDMFERMLSKLEEKQADIIVCNYFSAKGDVKNAERMDFPSGYYNRERLKAEIFPKMIYAGGFYRFGIAPNIWNKMIKRDLVNTFLFTIDKRIRSGEDGLLSFGCLGEANSIWLLDDCLYYYRSRPDSMCRISDNKRLEENHILFDYHAQRYENNQIMLNQLYHYVVYQTLQAIAAEDRGLLKLKQRYPEIFRQSTEAASIKHVRLSDIKGKKNKLLLFRLKLLI